MRIREVLFSFIFWIITLLPTKSQSTQDYIVIEDLKPFWRVVTSDSLLAPYLDESDKKKIYFEIPPNQFKSKTLRVCADEEHYLFVNNKLYVRFNDQGCIDYPIDSLRKAHDVQSVWLTLYSNKLDADGIKTIIIDQVDQRYEVSDASLTKPEGRVLLKDNEFLIMTILMLGAILILRESRYKLFAEYFSVHRALSPKQKSDVLVSLSPVSSDHQIFESLYALLISFTVVYPNQLPIDFLDEQGFNNWSRLAQFSFWAAIAFVLIKMKLFLINLISRLFRIRQMALVHYFTYFRISLMIGLLGFIYSVLIRPLVQDIIFDLESYTGILLVGLLIARFVIVALVLNNKHTFRKLHLFFYLCTTELFPLIIFIKVFLK